MEKLINDFFKTEANGDVSIEEYPNGVKYFSNKTRKPPYHEYYKPLTEEQIEFLQSDINAQYKTSYVFPDWLKRFYKITNGCFVFFGAFSIHGEQTPLVTVNGVLEKAGLRRADETWMAPYDLREVNKFDEACKNRWLILGSYDYDGTEIAWDYKTQKIVAMYNVSESLSTKAWKKLKEVDYEKTICAEWDSFEEFFEQETKRIKAVMEACEIDAEEGFCDWEKTLPVGHEDHEE